MITKNKKLIFLFLFFVTIVIFVYVIISAIISTRKSTKTITSVPQIPQKLSSQPQFRLSVAKDDFDFPSELPLINIKPSSISEKEAYEIANTFEFQNEPIIAEDVINGLVYIWTNEKGSLTITSGLNKLSYTSTTDPYSVKNNVNEQKFIDNATNFLINNFLINPNNISSANITYLKNNRYSEGYEDATETDRVITQVSFNYKNSNFEILDTTPSLPKIFVRILNDGSIYEAQFTKLGEITPSPEKYPVKSYEEVLNSLNNSIVVQIKNVYLSLDQFMKDDISSINIDNIKLAYYLESPNNTSLQPIFVMEGKAESRKYGKQLEPILYLPAIKNL